jgi:branched-chain amino acid transport system substrate-binding protein
MPYNPTYPTEAKIYAKYILAHQPNAKIAVLYQNDDFGKDYLQGIKEGLGAAAATMVVATASYEASDPTIDSQIVTLKGSGADVFLNVSTPKFAAMAIRKAYDIGWKPMQYLSYVSSSIASVLAPAGLDKSTGIITTLFGKDPTDKQWDNDQGMKEYRAFMSKYYPEANPADALNTYGYSAAQAMVHILKQCGDNLTRENVMKQAANMKGVHLSLELPGMHGLVTSPTDYYPNKQARLARFDGQSWVMFGEILGD